MSEPPLIEAGADQFKVTSVELTAVLVRLTGAEAGPRGTIVNSLEANDSPAPFTAVIFTLYEVPFTRFAPEICVIV